MKVRSLLDRCYRDGDFEIPLEKGWELALRRQSPEGRSYWAQLVREERVSAQDVCWALEICDELSVVKWRAVRIRGRNGKVRYFDLRNPADRRRLDALEQAAKAKASREPKPGGEEWNRVMCREALAWGCPSTTRFWEIVRELAKTAKEDECGWSYVDSVHAGLSFVVSSFGDTCKACDGQGVTPANNRCPTCRGTGRVKPRGTDDEGSR